MIDSGNTLRQFTSLRRNQYTSWTLTTKIRVYNSCREKLHSFLRLCFGTKVKHASSTYTVYFCCWCSVKFGGRRRIIKCIYNTFYIILSIYNTFHRQHLVKLQYNIFQMNSLVISFQFYLALIHPTDFVSYSINRRY